VRAFIAIDVPEDARASIRGIIRNIGADSRGVKWVPAQNIHLTLKFLGDVRDDLIPVIKKRLELLGSMYQPFTVDIRGAGVFPNFRNPNVLWIGIEALEGLKSLFMEIDISLSEIGFAREDRGFSPHLTIGRVKDKRGIDPVVKELATYKDTFFGTIEVREILLMESVLTPSGAEYSEVAVIRLGEDNK
jgi:2'-5' RNA ligase